MKKIIITVFVTLLIVFASLFGIYSCEKNKYREVTSVTLNMSTLDLDYGETYTLKAYINPSNATILEVTWISTDTNIATVDNGVVKAVGSGEATIIVTTVDGEKSATCHVKVCDNLKFELSLDKTEYKVIGLYKYDDEYVEIPAIYKDLPVTEIDDYAFDRHKNLKTLVVPESVVNIGWRAFDGCSALKQITYKGALKDWEKLEENNIEWNYGTNTITVYCLNGFLTYLNGVN